MQVISSLVVVQCALDDVLMRPNFLALIQIDKLKALRGKSLASEIDLVVVTTH